MSLILLLELPCVELTEGEKLVAGVETGKVGDDEDPEPDGIGVPGTAPVG